ncbi:MAG: hypothetical protein AAB736_02550, partial [Patescibacteria group bacterium]
ADPMLFRHMLYQLSYLGIIYLISQSIAHSDVICQNSYLGIFLLFIKVLHTRMLFTKTATSAYIFFTQDLRLTIFWLVGGQTCSTKTATSAYL